MERKIQRLLIVLLMVLISGLFLGCAMLKDFKPASADEQSIKGFFLSMEDAWNKKDINGVLASYHNDAKIMTGQEQKVVSKKEYAESLGSETSGLKKSGIIKYGIPKIKFNEDKAEVHISMTPYEYQVVLRAKFLLARSDGGWLIMERTYTY